MGTSSRLLKWSECGSWQNNDCEFYNQSGLKQIGNSTFISTAASGDPELGRPLRMGLVDFVRLIGAI